MTPGETLQNSRAGAPPRLITVRQAAKQLGVAERTLHGAIRSGELEAVKLGARTVRVPLPALNKWLRRCKVETPAQRAARKAAPRWDSA